VSRTIVLDTGPLGLVTNPKHSPQSLACAQWLQALDGDVILAGQAMTLPISDVLIATTNVGHLSRFVPAETWQNIRPS
jgi:hypothetical protein